LKRTVASALLALSVPILAAAQTAPPPQPERSDPDVLVDPLQPDFNLAALPTTLRMPRGKWAFRITHRFTRPLGQGNFGDLLSDAFGFDGGAQIGLELRYGLMPGTQVGVHRTSDKSIQFFGQHNFLNERDGRPVGLDAIVTVEGIDNFQDFYRSGIGALISRNAGRFAALYAEPIVVVNSSPFDTGDNSTLMLGLGGRLRVRPSLYVMAEVTPRLAGFDPGAHQISVGIEGRSGGHLFQINFSNDFATTLGQLAQGARNYDDWYIGFNISRKFFR
jgi:Membrane bound beta barrel domain (DUF5777)